jgi:stringent starvation protein B
MSNTPVEPVPYAVPINSFLLRATREWIEANDGTPHFIISPVGIQPFLLKFLHNGTVTLNVGSRATGGFVIDEDHVSFDARFNGVSHRVMFPVANVLEIYDRENPMVGRLIMPPCDAGVPAEPEPPKRPVFTVVK